MSISWYEKKLHQEKPPNPLLIRTKQRGQTPFRYFQQQADLDVITGLSPKKALQTTRDVGSTAAADQRDC